MCIFVQFPAQPKCMQWCCYSCLCCSGNSGGLGREDEAEGGLPRWAAVSGAKRVHGEKRIQSKCQGEGWWMFGISEWSTWFLLEEMILKLKEQKKIGDFNKGTNTELVEKAEENCNTKFLCLMEKLRIKDKESCGRDGENKIFGNT